MILHGALCAQRPSLGVDTLVRERVWPFRPINTLYRGLMGNNSRDHVQSRLGLMDVTEEKQECACTCMAGMPQTPEGWSVPRKYYPAS